MSHPVENHSKSMSAPASVLDFFTIGIGPSSSHTVGPMKAAAAFAAEVVSRKLPAKQVKCDLHGSLAATGKGHGTGHALILGLSGEQPDRVDVDRIGAMLDTVRESGQLSLNGQLQIKFDARLDLDFQRLDPLPRHANGMHFVALGENDAPLHDEIVYSVGGGFILCERDRDQESTKSDSAFVDLPYPFDTGAELLAHCAESGLSVAGLSLANENALRPEAETRARLDAIWQAMQDCVRRGCRSDGHLPGGLQVKRLAPALHRQLEGASEDDPSSPLSRLDWVNLYALAVNEENAAGGRVVTAPTNGAAGILPAVMHYADRFVPSPHPDAIHRFLLTAGSIALLYKKNASLSGADVGCQGEVGVACSMAAGAFAEWLGGCPKQVECAAEIGMEHNLGLTCDPVGGLVQIPCIERNAMGAAKAINAARLAIRGDGDHIVSLDKVIRTMRDTGRDMMDKYKETSRGGLAVNVVEC